MSPYRSPGRLHIPELRAPHRLVRKPEKLIYEVAAYLLFSVTLCVLIHGLLGP